MNTPRLRFTLYTIIMSLTLSILTPTIAAAHPSAGNDAHFWGDIIDNPSDKQYSDQFSNRHYARASAANLDVGEPRTVRLIYFLPNDRPYQADVVQRMKTEIRVVQDFYAAEMQARGYGNITFRVETDPQGEPMVHRVAGPHPDSYYSDKGTREIFDIVFDEIGQQFDVSANIYVAVFGNSQPITGLGGRRGKNSGRAIFDTKVNWKVMAHELGHAFGLHHDFSNDAYIMSYGSIQNQLSACSAEYLSVHPYFNPNVQSEDMAPTVELISPQIYPAEAKNVPIKLKVSDAAGLHQVILFVTTQTLWISAGFPEVKACQGLGGVTDTIVEFDYDGVTPSDSLTSLSTPTRHPITIEAIDVNGNTSYYHFNLESDSPESYIVDDIFDLYRGIDLEGGSLASVLSELLSEDPDWRRLVGLGLDYQNIRDLVEIVSALSGMPNLKRLDLSSNDISDLSPLSGLTNLTELYLGGNFISDLSPLSGLTNLTLLDLRANSISDLSPVSGLTNLTNLELGVNLISDLSPVSGLTNLTFLRLDGNSISDLSPVSGLTNLTNLWLDGDSISDLSPVSGLTNLTFLRLDGNSISDLSPVSSLTYLTDLWLKGNNSISDISAVSGLKYLTFLGLERNSISDLSAVSGLTNLTDLRLNDNDISDISVLGDLKSLESLALGDNNISDISALAGLPLLRYLAVHGNPLNYTSIYTHIPALQARGVHVVFHEQIVGFVKGSGDQHIAPAASLPIAVTVYNSSGSRFAGVPVIFTLTSGSGTLSATAATTDRNGRAESTLTLGADVGTRTVEVSVAGIEQPLTFTIEGKQGVIIPDSNLRAKIGEVLGKGSTDQISPSEIAKLTSLSAPNASISNLTGLEHATNLTGLDLRGNSISDLSAISGLTNLTGLDLSGNSISDISAVSGLTNLTYLDLVSSLISDLSAISDLTNLTYLGLSNNDISDISAVSGLTNLTSLYLDNNDISDISAVSGLTNLTLLRLGGNDISDISAVSGLTNLTYLNLVGNSISDISAVSGLTNLTRLILHDNDISDISAVSGLTNLTLLRLGGNDISDISAVSGLTNLTSLYLDNNDISDISAVSGLTNLAYLELGGNSVSHISAVSGLKYLTRLNLSNNDISDISPLIASKGLDSGDTVDVRGNPLSYASIHTHIPTLQGRGVEVYFDDRASPGLVKISGDNQTGTATVALANPFIVEVQYSDGTGLAGISVRFTVTEGDGTLSAIHTTTDANGRAESTLTLGPHLGTNTVSASVKLISGHWGSDSVDWRVTFNAVADTESPQMAADVNGDGVVNILDLVSIAASLKSETPNLTADVNGDGVVNVLDLILVAGLFESAAAAPAAGPQIPETLTAVEVQGWLTDAISLEVKDVIMKRGIAVLEQLLIALTPAVTELLPNYPNPFNPETWIPYRLAEDAFVTLTIYDTAGQVVRTLDVGHRIASAYETRSKAIYWDGRNGLGEGVASGVYFYHLSAGDYSATRRMVILK